jgi:hypothetical protein
MSTLQATPHTTHSLRNGLNAAIATLAVLIAAAVAVIVIAPGGTTTGHHVASVATANDTSAAYAPPHDYGVPRPTSTHLSMASLLAAERQLRIGQLLAAEARPFDSHSGGIATNDQSSSAYSRARLVRLGR